MAETTQEQASVERKQITVNQLKEDLKNGIDRKGIAKKYGVTQTVVAGWFKNPKLKNLKVIRKVDSGFDLVDDDTDYAETTTEELAPASGSSAQETVAAPVTNLAQEAEVATNSAAATTATASPGAW